MVNVIFDVSEGTKVKKKWVIGIFGILLIVSFVMLSLGYPINKGTSLALVIGFLVVFILKIAEMIEGNKLVEKKSI
ncbi:hypothetical protein KAJ38_01850 [Candidatus Pacearchaeota archaeon]|nr:hypothetical protein [Candidatus Pacearchaeota archaeon]